jgi:hypothetical protein
MRRKAGEVRTFTDAEQQWIRDHWTTARSIEGMALHLHCRIPVLKREAKLMGLEPRGYKRGDQSPVHMARMRSKQPVKASQLRVKRRYNKGCERVKDIDGEKSSPPPEGILYACPGCGMRALEAIGHVQCLAKVA